MEHTKEPWRIVCHTCETPADIEDGDDYTITGADGTAIAFEPTRRDPNCGAYARRIVACVNACAGISDEELEIVADGDETLKLCFARLTKQRDELVAALKKIVATPHMGQDIYTLSALDIATKAIASVEERK